MRGFKKLALTLMPKTAYYTYDDIKSGFGGAGVLYNSNWYMSHGLEYSATLLSCWIGEITGSSATILLQNCNPANASVSIDGGPQRLIKQNGDGSSVLFSGLPDIQHTVCFYPAGFGTSSHNQEYVKTTGVWLLSVTGAAPKINMPTTVITSGDYQANTVQTGYYETYLQNSVTNVGAVPPTVPTKVLASSATKGVLSQGSMMFKTSATKLIATSTSNFLFISIDGGEYTRYDYRKGQNKGNAIYPIRKLPYMDDSLLAPGNNYYKAGNPCLLSWTIPLDGLTHTYNVWTGSLPDYYNLFVVALDSTLQSLPAKAGRMDQFGDSLTCGLSSTSQGETDCMQIAAKYGYAGNTYGISGEKITGIGVTPGIATSAATTDAITRIPNILPGFTVNSNDIAIVAWGRNGADGGLSATDATNYTTIINLLLAKGYGKVLVRGVIPENATIPALTSLVWADHTFPACNTGLQAMVTAMANPKVIYINVDGYYQQWQSSTNATHPSDFGYTQWAALGIVAYAPYV